MAGSSVGHGYYMPIDMLLKKNEMTCMGNASIDDDMEMLNQYNRQQLVDFREPKSQYEEDAPRYDTHSREKLSLRHNLDRSNGVMPYLPDGTFLDQIFLSDLGNSELPNFGNLRNQIDERVRKIPLYTDEDYSVPTKERSSSEFTTIRDKLYKQAQKRYQIFDTSLDYIQMPNPIGKPLHGGSQLKKLITDQTPSFMSEEASSNRNWQVELSNRTPVGWQTTPDTMFKVSKYDTPRKMADQTVDSYNNRIGGKLDTDFLVSFEGKNIPRSLALTIMEIMRQKQRVLDFAKTTGTQYGRSKEEINRKVKQLDSRMMDLMRRYSSQSATKSSNQMLNSERKNVSGTRYIQKDDPNKIYKSLVGLQLASMIKHATNNRKLGKQDSDDLRDQIIQTATSDAIFNEAGNSSFMLPSGSNKMLWESLSQHKRDEQMTVFNYAGIRPAKQGLAGSHDMFVVDEYDRLSHPDIANKKIITDNNLYGPDVLEYEDIIELDTPMRNINSIGRGNRGRGMTTRDARIGDMMEADSMMHTQPSRVRSIF
jgi:hypothetical protein